MDDKERREFHQLMMKVQQHESAIAQLMEILAATNSKLHDLDSSRQKQRHYHLQI